jgi:hypothetical protein
VSERAPLPNYRAHELIDFWAMNVPLTAGVGRFEDGKIAELFLDTRLTGSALDTIIREIAICFSFAAQHGADVAAIRRALPRDGVGQALGPLGTVLDLLHYESTNNK